MQKISKWIALFLLTVTSVPSFCQTPQVDIEFVKPAPTQQPDEKTREETKLKKEEKKELTEEELKTIFTKVMTNLLQTRNKALVKGDLETLKQLYNVNSKLSRWAYESEAIKQKYLTNWAKKQGITFSEITSTLKLRKVRQREENLYGLTCNVATTYTYSYKDTPHIKNHFKLGTSHYLQLRQEDDHYIVVKEWYTDPFADSLQLTDIDAEEMATFILSQKKPDYKPSQRVQDAIAYAHKYSGVWEEEEGYLFKYNKNYANCNPRGGDCANFASQILYEGGKFKKTGAWNYSGQDGTKAWVNAQGFKNFMVASGRGSYIAKGSYSKIYKAAYKMRPGDFVAYEKKGRIVHISTVTGLDSKGYPLVTCHNTDRLLVPYDLGWSNKNITFHLVHMHY
jgi:hypothetical protein